MIWLERIAYILTLAAAFFYWEMPQYAPFVLILAAVILIVIRLLEKSEKIMPKEMDKSLQLRATRIFRIRRFVGICWLFAGYMMFRPGNFWILALLISVVLDLYSMFVIERIIKKSNLQK